MYASEFQRRNGMKVLVMGSGAVGGYIGGLLSRSGEDVTFVARGANLEAIRQRGIRVESVHAGQLHHSPAGHRETRWHLQGGLGAFLRQGLSQRAGHRGREARRRRRHHDSHAAKWDRQWRPAIEGLRPGQGVGGGHLHRGHAQGTGYHSPGWCPLPHRVWRGGRAAEREGGEAP